MGTKKPEIESKHEPMSVFQEVTRGRSAVHSTGIVKLDPKPAFLFFASESEVELVKGKVMPMPLKVRLEPGAMVTSKGDFGPLLQYQAKNGRILVDGDMVVTAWGKQVKGYIQRIKVGLDAGGGPVYHYHDVWTRYVKVGSQTKMEFDHDGYNIFRQQLLGVLGIDEIHPAIAGPMVGNARSELARARQTARINPAQAIAVIELEESLSEE